VERVKNKHIIFVPVHLFHFSPSHLFTPMSTPLTGLLLFSVIAAFAAMVFLNVYFRVKVFKSYKTLVKNRVEFGAAHLFNKERMEREIMPKYPHMREEIETFVRHLRFSIRMATVLIALITLFGAILMYFR